MRRVPTLSRAMEETLATSVDRIAALNRGSFGFVRQATGSPYLYSAGIRQPRGAAPPTCKEYGSKASLLRQLAVRRRLLRDIRAFVAGRPWTEAVPLQTSLNTPVCYAFLGVAAAAADAV
jgi:hypothetical protein